MEEGKKVGYLESRCKLLLHAIEKFAALYDISAEKQHICMVAV
jgi:hypothetical protein